MSQRESGYARIERDNYETPEWVTTALVYHLPAALRIWEPAAGSGKMAKVLRQYVHQVTETDIETGLDFLTAASVDCNAIITNPPYELAQEFIERALSVVSPLDGIVAMLLRTDFDHAKTRRHLFANEPRFSQKVVLTRRIQWFEHSTASPSFNHAWFIWDARHQGPPTLAYEPLS